jgi:sulfite exporter TauE/SafE
MIELFPVLTTAFVTGLLGSAHCFGMCGGISGLFSMNVNVASLKAQFPKAIAYNAGRVLSYAILGAAVALLGKSLVSGIPHIAAPVRFASGVLIILVGLQLAFGWRILAPLESAGAKVWNRIAPAAKGLVPVETVAQALGLGVIWGWLPCGLVYSVLLLAATTAESTSGGLVMVAFGLGTMPAMIATGISASKLAQFMSGKRLGAGLMIVLLGLATIAMPVMTLASSNGPMDHSQHGRLLQDEMR